MAKGVTLDEARAYFVGQEFEQSDGTMKAVASVDLRPCFLFTFEGGSSRVVAGKEDETVDIARERYVGEKFAWASGRVLTVEAA